MDSIASQVRAQDAEFQSNRKNMKSLVSELAGNLKQIRERDETSAAKLHRSRGKLMPAGAQTRLALALGLRMRRPSAQYPPLEPCEPLGCHR